MRSRTTREGRRAGWWALIAALALTGCEEATAPEDEPLSELQAEAVATLLSDVDATGGDFYGLESDARSGSYEFSRTASCPAGGSHGVSGSGTRSLDEASKVLSSTWTTIQTHDDCAVTRTRGDQSVTVVVDGSVTATGSASWQLPPERGQPRQILSFSNHRAGSTTATAGDRSRTCEVDVTESYDPATDTFTITGTICGREVNVTRRPGERPRR